MLRPSTCLPLLLCVASCAAPVIRTESFGVVGLTSDLRLPCVTFSASADSGERVQVILLPSQKVIAARVIERIPECGFGQEAGYAYKLQLDEKVEQVRGSIAVRGPVPEAMTFRECSGSESSQLTAWLRGRRVWHGYYYLGYDVEPNCRPEEID
jgi:hypothetical protein